MLKQDHLQVNSDLAVLNQVLHWFEQFCCQYLSLLSWSESHLCDRLKLALDEGFTNAVRHAHKDLPPETPIDIDLALWDDRLEIRIWDRGKPFNPDELKEPEPGTLLSEGGYGWFLLRRLPDCVTYERGADGRNCLLIVKKSKQRQPN